MLGLGALVAGSFSPVFAQNAPPTTNTAPPANGARVRGGQRQGNPLETALKAVDLTADQKTKIKAIAEKFKADMAAITDRRSPEGRAKVRTLNEQTLASVKAVLTSEQQPKFQAAYDEALAWRSPYGRALEQLQLSSDEKSKVTPILVAQMSDVEKMRQDTSIRGAARREKMAAMVTDLKAKIRPLLTADHQTQLDSLDLAARRGGGRQGGRRGGAAGAPAAEGGQTT